MTVLLLANVGNRDVWVDKAAPIPGEVHPLWNKQASRRELGRALLANWENCHSHLGLPIIGKALNYAREQSGQIDQVILISSDQADQEGVADRHQAQDTCELAPVVERLLVEDYGLAPDTILHWTVRHNPADYGRMQTFFRERLTSLHEAEPDATTYLELSGGTPAMTSMLLVVGAEVLGLKAHPLYVSQHEEQPFPLDLGRRLVADALAETLKANLEIYAYHAAAQTVRDNRALLREFFAADALLAVLEYARQRLNFNFEQAQQALEKAPPGPWSARLTQLAADLKPDQAQWLLQEILHNAKTRLETGAYGDFLTRLFRFDEATSRYTALRLGARLVDKKGHPDPEGEFLDPDWLDEVPELERYLVEEKNVRGERTHLPANRYVLSLVAAFFGKRQEPKISRALRKGWGKINKLSKVRHQSFAVHTFDGVSRQRIAQAFTGETHVGDSDSVIQEILATTKEIYALSTGESFDPLNPYTAINALCTRMIAS